MIRFRKKIKATPNSEETPFAATAETDTNQETKAAEEEEQQKLTEEEEQVAEEEQMIEEEEEENIREADTFAKEETSGTEKPEPPAKGRTPAPRSFNAKKVRNRRRRGI